MRYTSRDRTHLDLATMDDMVAPPTPATYTPVVRQARNEFNKNHRHETKASRHALRQQLHDIERGGDPYQLP